MKKFSTVSCTFCNFMLEMCSSILKQLWTLSHDHSSPAVQWKISDTVRFMREELFQENDFYSNMFQAYQA